MRYGNLRVKPNFRSVAIMAGEFPTAPRLSAPALAPAQPHARPAKYQNREYRNQPSRWSTAAWPRFPGPSATDLCVEFHLADTGAYVPQAGTSGGEPPESASAPALFAMLPPK